MTDWALQPVLVYIASAWMSSFSLDRVFSSWLYSFLEKIINCLNFMLWQSNNISVCYLSLKKTIHFNTLMLKMILIWISFLLIVLSCYWGCVSGVGSLLSDGSLLSGLISGHNFWHYFWGVPFFRWFLPEVCSISNILDVLLTSLIKNVRLCVVFSTFFLVFEDVMKHWLLYSIRYLNQTLRVEKPNSIQRHNLVELVNFITLFIAIQPECLV